MRDAVTFAEFRAAADGLRPSAAIVLGSGLAGATAAYVPVATVNFADVPGLAPAGVHGHAGKVSVGRWADVPTVVFHGRLHFYEGHSWDVVTGPVRLAAELGVKRIVLTNAAGGIHKDLNPGELMLIRGHLVLFPSPLGVEALGVRGDIRNDSFFPTISTPYSSEINSRLQATESAAGRRLQTGVYAAMTGPCYETPAEIRALAATGADAVGMSTAMEAEAAAACGLEVVGISCITNKAAGLTGGVLSHEEVQITGSAAAQRVGDLIRTILV
jgi:purine-nucleoside phosphorylase